MVLLHNYEVRAVANAAVSAGTEVTSSTVDTIDAESVTFMTRIATGNAGNYLKVTGSTDDSTYVDLAGSRATGSATPSFLMVEVSKPITYRYLRCNIIRAGANTATEMVTAVVHRSAKPPTNTTTGYVATVVVSPATGTP